MRELATEMAVLVEHYDQHTAAWFPESVIAIRKAADELLAAKQLLPEPVYYVLARCKRRLGGHVLTVDDVAQAIGLTRPEVSAMADAGTMPGARRSGNRWVFDRDSLIEAGLIVWQDPHEFAYNAAMSWVVEIPSALSTKTD